MNATPESGPPKWGKYLYAIAALSKDRAYDVAGIDGRLVQGLSNGRVAAVVSDCARQKLRPERIHLAAHKEVLKRLMLESTVLPMAFGIIADDDKAVRRLLRLNQKAFLKQLERVADKVEMGVRVKWDVPNIFEYFIDIHPELRAARDRLLGNQREPRQEDKIELGQLFDRILNDDREAHSEKLEAALAPCCAEIQRSSPRDVNEVANLNCLVARNGQKQLEDAVFQAAGLFDNNYAFDLNGPWAPHNFVEMDLKLNGTG
jgi:cytidylate kinase